MLAQCKPNNEIWASQFWWDQIKVLFWYCVRQQSGFLVMDSKRGEIENLKDFFLRLRFNLNSIEGTCPEKPASKRCNHIQVWVFFVRTGWVRYVKILSGSQSILPATRTDAFVTASIITSDAWIRGDLVCRIRGINPSPLLALIHPSNQCIRIQASEAIVRVVALKELDGLWYIFES